MGIIFSKNFKKLKFKLSLANRSTCPTKYVENQIIRVRPNQKFLCLIVVANSITLNTRADNGSRGHFWVDKLDRLLVRFDEESSQIERPSFAVCIAENCIRIDH